MEIIIGREESGQSRLYVECNGEIKLTDIKVPKSVSRKHLKIIIADNSMLMQNIDPSNDAWVNSRRFEQCRITMESIIKLGKDQFKLELPLIFRQLNLPVSISHLKKVWEDFHKAEMKIVKDEKRMNALPMSFGGLSALCFVFSFNRDNTVQILSAVGLVLCVGYRMLFPAKDIEKKDRLNDMLRKKYVCPCCNKFLGKNKYEYLLDDGKCPHCKVSYKG